MATGPRRVGRITLNSVPYMLAPEDLTRSPAIEIRSASKDLLPDPSRRDIIPVAGGMPGEFWLWYSRFDGGIAHKHYRRPHAQRVTISDTALTLADSRFGWLSLDDTVLKELTWTGESQPLWGIFEQNNQLLFGNGQVVKLAANPVTEDVDFAATDADANTINGVVNWEIGNADVAIVGTGSHIFRRATTWTSAAIATEFLAVGPDRLWKSYAASGSYFVANCRAGDSPLTAGNWSAGIRVGNAANPINGVAVLGDELLIGARNGLFGVTPAGVVFNRTPHVVPRSENGWLTKSLLGYVWYSTAQDGLFLYRDGTIYSDQGPRVYSDERHALKGIVSANQIGEWVYAIHNNATFMSVYRARLRRSTDEPGGILKWFIWKLFHHTNTDDISQVKQSEVDVDGEGNIMIWIARDGAASGIYTPDAAHFDTTEGTSRPSAASLADASEFWFPEDDLGFPAANKLLRAAMVYGRQIDTTRLVRLKGEFDQGTAFTDLDMTAAATLANFSGSNLSGKVLTDWYLTLFDSADGLTGPIVERFGLKFFVRPDQDRVFILRLLLSGQVDDGVANIRESTESQMANLLALAENTVTLTLGSSHNDYTVLIDREIAFTLVKDTQEAYWMLAELTAMVI